MAALDRKEQPSPASTNDERCSGWWAMLGDAAVPREPVEQERLRRPVEGARRIGFRGVQILEQFYINGQEAIPRSPLPQWLSQEPMCKPPIRRRARSII